MGRELFFRLPNHSTILQAEVRAIAECIRELSAMEDPAHLNIFTNSRMAVRTLLAERIRSRKVLDCKTPINGYSEHGLLEIIFVKAHAGVAGDESENFLALKATGLSDIHLACAKAFGGYRSGAMELGTQHPEGFFGWPGR